LKAITCQRLLPGVQEGSRYPATEVLLANSIVKQKILREEDEDLPAILHQCREEGMRDYTHSLCELVNEDKILRTTALDYAPSRESLLSALKGIDSATSSILSRVR
jgi:twitching motility protein PilT